MDQVAIPLLRTMTQNLSLEQHEIPLLCKGELTHRNAVVRNGNTNPPICIRLNAYRRTSRLRRDIHREYEVCKKLLSPNPALLLDTFKPDWRRLSPPLLVERRAHAGEKLCARAPDDATVAFLSIPQAIVFAQPTGLPTTNGDGGCIVDGFVAALLFADAYIAHRGPSLGLVKLVGHSRSSHRKLLDDHGGEPRDFSTTNMGFRYAREVV